MDFANRGNRPNTTQQQPAGPQSEQPSTAFQPPTNNKKEGKKLDLSKLASTFVLFGIVFIVLALLIGMVFGGSKVRDESELIQEDKYQAVFLNSQDGQVYFGKLSVWNRDIYVLTDIYYVRVENPIQPEGANQPQEPNISLAKLGNELHGPQDFMFIRRDNILYWENLKDDGQVVTAITEFKESGGEEAQQQEQPAQGIQEGAGVPAPEQAPAAPPAPEEQNPATP